MAKAKMIPVAKKHLLAAWEITEELTVSLDQIGGAFGIEKGATNGQETHQAMLEAIGRYLTPRVVHALNNARMRLGEYLPDKEMEQLAEHKIPYWNYAGLKRPRKRPAAAPKKRKRATARQ